MCHHPKTDPGWSIYQESGRYYSNCNMTQEMVQSDPAERERFDLCDRPVTILETNLLTLEKMNGFYISISLFHVSYT